MASYGWAPIFIAEISTGLWLLIVGIRIYSGQAVGTFLPALRTCVEEENQCEHF